jgi:hypothetical protein
VTSRGLRLPILLAPLALLASGCGGASPQIPTCPPAGGGDPLILLAQSVPSAAMVPCIQQFPVGWNFGGQNIETGESTIWLDSDRAGFRALTVRLTPSCDTSEAVEVPTEADEAGTRRFEEPTVLPPAFAGSRYYVFPGGCIEYLFSFGPEGSSTLVVEATEALSFVSREEGVRLLRREGLILCGAGVECPT